MTFPPNWLLLSVTPLVPVVVKLIFVAAAVCTFKSCRYPDEYEPLTKMFFPLVKLITGNVPLQPSEIPPAAVFPAPAVT